MSTTIRYHVPDYLTRREQAKAGERRIVWAALGIAVVGVVLGSRLVAPMDRVRQETQMTLDPESTKGLPPDMALLTRTGTFRALAIDIAFIRLEQLKQENKFYELDKLSTLICKMAPRFASVWSYTAWNQAYNISVAQYAPEARWYWVRNGINLLRHEGIPYNDKTITLYRELAWIFWHKVGDFLDDQHWYYKKALAGDMERILGATPQALTDDAVIDSFAEIAMASPDLAALRASDADVSAFVEELAALNLQPDATLLEFVARHVRGQLQIQEVLAGLEKDDIRTEHESRIELLTDPKWTDARERLLDCLRHHALREQLAMDPQWMLQLMRDYGPLDWRSPYMHALYWATLGDMVTKGQLNLNENDSMNVVRYIFFALEQAIKRGKIVFEPDFDDPGGSYIELLPDSRYIPYLHEVYLRLGEEQFGDDPRFIPGTSGPNYMKGHFTFLGDWVRQLYTEGGSKNTNLAKEYYEYLRTFNRNDDGSAKEQYLQPLEKFVLQDYLEDLSGFKSANMTIGAWITRSLKLLSIGELSPSIAAMERAKMGWEYYREQTGIDPARTDRRSLPPLIKMRADAVMQFLTSPGIVPIHKVRLWRVLDLTTRQMTYDHLFDYFTELAAEHDPPMILDKAFPEPPGMDEFRANQPEPVEEDVKIELGEKAW